MKKSRLKFISAIVAVLGFALIAMACSPKETKTKAYDYLVTFNYNVGEIVANCPDQYVGVKEGARLLLKPGDSSYINYQPVAGYYLEAWYLPKLDENSEPVVGEDKRVILDKKWDFAADTVTSDITLYANLVANPKLIIEGGDEKVIFDGNPGATEVRYNTARLRPTKKGWTFTGYYEDSNYETKFDVSTSYVYGYEDKTIYAKFIEGDWAGKFENNEWKFVETAKEFTDALSQRKNIKLEKNIDFTGFRTPRGETWVYVSAYGGEIDGNGKTLSGIDASLQWTRTSGTENLSLFGKLSKTAYVHDLTVLNAKITFSMLGRPENRINVALFANDVEEGARISNVTVSGTLDLTGLTKENMADIKAYGGFANQIDGTVDPDCEYADINVIVPDFTESEQ